MPNLHIEHETSSLYSNFDYNRDLTKIAYQTDPHGDLAIYDVKSGTVTNIEEENVFFDTLLPWYKWSHDGNQIAQIGDMIIKSDSFYHHELFIYDSDGKGGRVSDFMSAYKEINIPGIAWSPDGQSVAFWAYVKPIGKQVQKSQTVFFVYELTTHNLVDYCIVYQYSKTAMGGGFGMGDIWSPDSTQVYLEVTNEPNRHDVILDVLTGDVSVLPTAFFNPLLFSNICAIITKLRTPVFSSML